MNLIFPKTLHERRKSFANVAQAASDSLLHCTIAQMLARTYGQQAQEQTATDSSRVNRGSIQYKS